MTATTKTLLAVITAASAITAGSAQAALIISDGGATTPTTNIFEEQPNGTTWTQFTNTSARGATFTTPLNGAEDGESWGLTAITIQTNSFQVEPETAPTMRLRIVEWGANLNSAGQNGTEIYNQTALFPVGGTITSGDHVVFDLGTTVNLTEGANYAFDMVFTTSGASFRPRVNAGTQVHEGALVNNSSWGVKTNQELEFYLTGTVVPEPGSLALLGIGGLLIGSRRRRG